MDQKYTTEASSLDKYAGPVALIKGEQVESLDEIEEGDRVACGSGKGRQGIVEQISENGTVYVSQPTGGFREYHHKKETFNDDTARFSLPGAPDRLHTLVVV